MPPSLSWEPAGVATPRPRGGWRQRQDARDQSEAAIARGAAPSEVAVPPLVRPKVCSTVALVTLRDVVPIVYRRSGYKV